MPKPPHKVEPKEVERGRITSKKSNQVTEILHQRQFNQKNSANIKITAAVMKKKYTIRDSKRKFEIKN